MQLDATFGASLVAQMVKNLPAMQETVLIPGSGRMPVKRNGYSLQYSYLGNCMVRGYHGVTKESDSTE